MTQSFMPGGLESENVTLRRNLAEAMAAGDRLRAELAIKDEVALGLMAALVERNDAIADARAELANVHHNAEMWYAEKLRAEATTARVRELFARPWVGYDTAQAFAADVLRALDGDTE